MILSKVQIENFRSIENTEPFSIDNLTCLVGKNEAGKTAVLQALHALRPFNKAKTEFDVTLEYPRRFVTKFDERHSQFLAPVVKTWWKIDGPAKAALEAEFGKDAVKGDEVQISKYYKDKVGTRWVVPVDEARAIKNLIEHAQFNDQEKVALGSPATAKDLVGAVTAIGEKTAKHTALLERVKAYRDQSVVAKAVDLVDDFVPKFFYTSHYDRMSGQISVNQLAIDRQHGKLSIDDEIFLEFLKLSGTSLEELQAATRYEDLIAKCEAASNDITQQIFAYWTQNEALEVKLDFSEGRAKDPAPFNAGTVVRARVWNSLHRASVPFSERSAGFVWFFSFLVQFAAMRGQSKKLIILLDEPGLTLHGKAQADLLRYIEQELLPHQQVIFSTHSPFMVPADNFKSVRIVEDVIDRSKSGRPEVKGTKIREDVLVTDRDTLFPLQGALGYDISQSLFVGKNSLLVEGPSDILYLQAFSDALKRRGCAGLDPRWTLCPAGGMDKIHPFVSLFGGNNLNVAVLSDQHVGDKKKIETLRRSQILKAGSLFTAVDFVGKAEGDIEDFFEPSVFVEILNSAYGLAGKLRLTVQKLTDADKSTPCLVKQAEAAFKLMPTTVAEFDHFTPASWLIRNPSTLDGDSSEVDKTLERAEAAFTALNKLLPAK
jgi:hypothetical protein